MIDEIALRQYKTLQMYLGDRTLFTDVKEDRTMYQPTRINGATIEQLRNVLEQSVYDCITDINIGCYVSGGLDSSTVAVMANEHLVVDGFHGMFPDDPEYNETQYANLLPVNLHAVPITQQDFVDNIEDVIRCLRYPIAGVGAFSQYMVANYAKEHCAVVLSGEGGDELFGGYARYTIAQLEEQIALAIEGDHKHLQHSAHNLTYLSGYEPMLRSFFSEGMFKTRTERYYRLLTRGTHDADVYRQFSRLFNDDGRPYMELMMSFDYNHVLPCLLHVDNSVNHWFGIEGHTPMLDERVVDLAYSIPPIYGKPKYTLRVAVADIVPPAILNRKGKMGFPTPFIKWVKQEGVVREYVKGVLGEIPDEDIYGRQLWGELCLAIWKKQNTKGERL